MVSVLGRWIEPTIDGPRRVLIDGVSFSIPEDALVKIVNASGRLHFGHIKHAGRVTVLSRFGQLDESDEMARTRAIGAQWGAIPK